jgi:hypothetical protein
MRVLVALSCLFSCLWATGDQQVRPVSPGSGLHAEFAYHAERWRTAVVTADLGDLVGYAMEFEREHRRRQLEDHRSRLWRALLGKRDSVRSFFVGSGPTEIRLFEHRIDEGDFYGVACYYPVGRGISTWPGGFRDLFLLSDKHRLFCIEFGRPPKGGWAVAYSFADEPEDDSPRTVR